MALGVVLKSILNPNGSRHHFNNCSTFRPNNLIRRQAGVGPTSAGNRIWEAGFAPGAGFVVGAGLNVVHTQIKGVIYIERVLRSPILNETGKQWYWKATVHSSTRTSNGNSSNS